MIAPQQEGNLADGPAKLTKKGKEKAVSKKSSKEENADVKGAEAKGVEAKGAEVKGAEAKSNSVQHNNSVGNVAQDGTPLPKYAMRRFVQRHLKLITLSAGYIINTFLYFWFIFLLNWVIDMLIYYLSKVSKYDYQSCMITTPLKMTVILFVWYRYFSAGYDGDPFFHFFKHRFGLINRSKSRGKSRPVRVHGSGVHGSGVHGSGVHGSGGHGSGGHGSGGHGSSEHDNHVYVHFTHFPSHRFDRSHCIRSTGSASLVCHFICTPLFAGEALVIFLSNVAGTCLYLSTVGLLQMQSSGTPLSGVIVETIQKQKVSRSNSILTAFVYQKIPENIEKIIINVILFTCPYKNTGNKYQDKIFMHNNDLYTSIIMDIYLNEMICSFLSYILLYIYMFTKDNLSFPIQINLILTQLISIFSRRYNHIIIGPFMSLSWILNDYILNSFPFFFFFFLAIFHYFGYKLASLLLKPPILSLHDASNYYKNIDPKILQKGVGPNGIVNLTSIPNELISDSSVVESYLGRLFQGLFHSFAMHEGGDFHTKKDL
ncbi:conserved Plasmodium protein, unknown function [Plasmodium ovale wallikeri]|uniref:Uncharacterized protein n=1 Tax=Plasmodium ovale wallikeri TaxID=864142 RepID=A0A1A8YGY9_PLAOA|nr:conserved Plasmodium protein, unknown function [Plasmodium ovale wallikeri]